MSNKHELVTQPTAKPTRKVLAAWLAGGGSTVVLAVLAAISDNLDGSTVVGAIVAAVAAGAAAYLQKNSRREV